MKSILISIKPKWCADIMNGEKTIEIRKTMPKCELPIDVYIYCTKGKDLTYKCINGGYDYDNWKVLENRDNDNHIFNGKVVAKFTLNKVSIIHDFVNDLELTEKSDRHTTIMNEEQLLKSCCLTKEELYKYGGNYAWHIDNLVIFDKPKELNEFTNGKYIFGKNYKLELYKLTKAPQSWCYVEVE